MEVTESRRLYASNSSSSTCDFLLTGTRGLELARLAGFGREVRGVEPVVVGEAFEARSW
jgi:hypothetical protein